jgi:adhesin transport system membrane fusion protein
LAVLDDSQARAELENTEAEYQTARAQKLLLETLIAGGDSLAFDPTMGIPADIAAQKLGLFQDTLRAYRGTLDNLQNELSLYQREIELLDKAAAGGGGTPIERLRLQQKMASLQTQIDTHSQDFLRDNSVKLDEVSANLAKLDIRRQAQSQLLAQTQIKAPGRGIVQDIAVSTAGGGVIPPNGTLLELIPLDDRLLVETQYSPRDIAFISEGQSARIKISAFDESIYGALTAQVLKVSPDSVKDERTGEYHFSVLLQADKTFFSSKDGKTYNITPGRTATSEILPGSRAVLQ